MRASTRPIRALALAAVVGAALLSVPAHGSAPQVLRGTTVITADRSGSADVVLYEDAVLRLQPDQSTRDITMSGKGRIVGFSLVLDGPGATPNSDSMSALRVRRGGKYVTFTGASGTTYPRPAECPTSGSIPAAVPGLYTGCVSETTPEYVVVHQGHYHLRVLTDGAPLRITLRLHGVPGRSRLHPTKALASGVQSLSHLDDVGGRYLRYETPLRLPQRAEATINLDAAFSRQPVLAGVQGCVYAAGSEPLPTDYAPECPGGERAGFFGPLLNPTRADYDSGSLFAVGTAELPPGPQRLGLSVTDEGGVAVRSATVAWLEAE